MKKKVKKKAVKKPKKKALKARKAVKKPEKKAAPPKKMAAAKKKAKTAKTSIPAGATLEEAGVVTHYFPKVEAAVVKMTKGTLSVGDTIIIKGHTTDFKENVDSIQLDRVPLTSASAGQEIGLKVKKKVRERDIVYKIVS